MDKYIVFIIFQKDFTFPYLPENLLKGIINR